MQKYTKFALNLNHRNIAKSPTEKKNLNGSSKLNLLRIQSNIKKNDHFTTKRQTVISPKNDLFPKSIAENLSRNKRNSV